MNMKNDMDELADQLHTLAYKWAKIGGEKDFMVLEQLQIACKESPHHKLKDAFYHGFEDGHWDRLTKDEKAKKRLSQIDFPKSNKEKGLSR